MPPIKSCQPTPGRRLGVFWPPSARCGCTLRSAARVKTVSNIWAGLCLLMLCADVHAGDGFGGTNRYDLDLGVQTTNHVLSAKDRRWAESYKKNTGAKEAPIYFVRTSLALRRDGRVVDTPIYQRADDPRWYFVPEGNVMINLANGSGYYAGNGEYAARRPRSRNFVVFFKLLHGGLKLDTPHSDFKKGPIWWTADLKIGGMDSE